MSLRQEIDTSLNVIKMICHCFVSLSSVDLEQKSRTLEICGLYLSPLFVFFSLSLSLSILSAHSLVVIEETQ